MTVSVLKRELFFVWAQKSKTSAHIVASDGTVYSRSDSAHDTPLNIVSLFPVISFISRPDKVTDTPVDASLTKDVFLDAAKGTGCESHRKPGGMYGNEVR